MAQLARLKSKSSITHSSALVLAREGQRYILDVDGTPVAAGRALSCLVEPQVDDLVMLAQAATGSYILAVLERFDESALQVHSAREIRISSDQRLAFEAEELSARARTGSFVIERMKWVGAELLAHLARIEWVGDMLDSISERLRISTRRSYRDVEELDQLHAGQVDHRVDHTYSLRSKHTVMASEGLVKVDGAQIHLG